MRLKLIAMLGSALMLPVFLAGCSGETKTTIEMPAEITEEGTQKVDVKPEAPPPPPKMDPNRRPP